MLNDMMKDLFQSPIGTQKTQNTHLRRYTTTEFQSPIGTQKT